MKLIRKRDRRGAAVVEMAMVLPIFVMVVLGIVEFGRAMMVGQMVTNAAREATRLAIVDGSSNSSVTAWVESFLNDTLGVNASDVNVVITVDPAPGNDDPLDKIEDAQARDLVTIKVDVPFDKVSYIPGDYLSGKKLKAQSAMRHE
ncbi:MAG: TadE/TadG family type IV pilus assembly protein [Planctomycetota bacterium]|nr:TadE/TadG family type IV pilus assembly protein [Planctomycetota bacterium]